MAGGPRPGAGKELGLPGARGGSSRAGEGSPRRLGGYHRWWRGNAAALREYSRYLLDVIEVVMEEAVGTALMDDLHDTSSLGRWSPALLAALTSLAFFIKFVKRSLRPHRRSFRGA